MVLDAVTGVDPHPLHLGRVGMGFGAQHACRHHAGHAAGSLQVLDREPEVRQRVDEPVDVVGERRELAQP